MFTGEAPTRSLVTGDKMAQAGEAMSRGEVHDPGCSSSLHPKDFFPNSLPLSYWPCTFWVWRHGHTATVASAWMSSILSRVILSKLMLIIWPVFSNFIDFKKKKRNLYSRFFVTQILPIWTTASHLMSPRGCLPVFRDTQNSRDTQQVEARSGFDCPVVPRPAQPC